MTHCSCSRFGLGRARNQYQTNDRNPRTKYDCFFHNSNWTERTFGYDERNIKISSPTSLCMVGRQITTNPDIVFRTMVHPLESTVETQPQLQPALLRLSAMISQYFTRVEYCRFCSAHDGNEKKWKTETRLAKRAYPFDRRALWQWLCLLRSQADCI
jgi:hypothetical protein